jgi:hypothetical protein
MTADSWARESEGNRSVLLSWWARLLVLGLAVSAVSVFVITPSLTRPLALHFQYSPALGPLLSVADVAAENQVSGKIEFGLVSLLILLPIVSQAKGTYLFSLTDSMLSSYPDSHATKCPTDSRRIRLPRDQPCRSAHETLPEDGRLCGIPPRTGRSPGAASYTAAGLLCHANTLAFGALAGC